MSANALPPFTLVTGNPDKRAEAERILGRAVECAAIDLPEPQSLDFFEVVRAKAAEAYRRLGRPVVVGDVGSDKRVDYTVLGNTVNVAARLEQAATGPGEIVIGGATLAELAGCDGEFRTESLGEFSLKGLVQKVPVYRVQWAE